MPEGGLQDTSIYDAGGGTTDGIFKLLPEQEEGDGDSGTGSGGEGWQDCEDGEGTQADKDQAAAEMKVSVAQAAQAAKMMGVGLIQGLLLGRTVGICHRVYTYHLLVVKQWVS